MFAVPYYNTEGNNKVSINSFKKYFLPRVKIENYDIEIDGRNFYDQSINDSTKQYSEIIKKTNRASWWLHNWLFIGFCLFWKNYRLIAADLSKQKDLDADWRAIQQIIFTGKIKSTEDNARVKIYYVLEQSKETILEFSKGWIQ